MLIFIIISLLLVYYLIDNKKDESKVFLKRKATHRRNDRNRMKDYHFTKEDRKNILNKFDNKCFKCGSKSNLTLDHHYPLSMGYPLKKDDGTYNAVVLCAKCNRKKSNKLPQFFYNKNELLILSEKFGLKETKPENLDIHTLIKEKKNIEFNYLGKIYRGIPLNILNEDIKLIGIKRKIYLEVDIKGEKNLFPLNQIKNIKKPDF